MDKDEQLACNIAETVGGVPCAADVTSREDMQRIFDMARCEFGRVHGVIDIIGVAGIKPFSAVDDTGWEQQFDIVLRHAYLAIQIGGEIMASDGGGSFAFVGSMSGNRAVPNQTAYAVSKAALHHLVRCAGTEYAPRKVRVNAVAPGYVRTPRLNRRLDEAAWSAISKVIPIGRPATPAEIAGPLLFLASDLSAHMTGEVMAVDGGAGVIGAFPDVKFGPAMTP
ncbi:3-oxoacyl-[acyl-carrier-protein] reductase FabG1 [compost metagenome]